MVNAEVNVPGLAVKRGKNPRVNVVVVLHGPKNKLAKKEELVVVSITFHHERSIVGIKFPFVASSSVCAICIMVGLGSGAFLKTGISRNYITKLFVVGYCRF